MQVGFMVEKIVMKPCLHIRFVAFNLGAAGGTGFATVGMKSMAISIRFPSGEKLTEVICQRRDRPSVAENMEVCSMGKACSGSAG